MAMSTPVVSELSLPRALHSDWTPAWEERVQDNLLGNAQKSALFSLNWGGGGEWRMETSGNACVRIKNLITRPFAKL